MIYLSTLQTLGACWLWHRLASLAFGLAFAERCSISRFCQQNEILLLRDNLHGLIKRTAITVIDGFLGKGYLEQLCEHIRRMMLHTSAGF